MLNHVRIFKINFFFLSESNGCKGSHSDPSLCKYTPMADNENNVEEENSYVTPETNNEINT